MSEINFLKKLRAAEMVALFFEPSKNTVILSRLAGLPRKAGKNL